MLVLTQIQPPVPVPTSTSTERVLRDQDVESFRDAVELIEETVQNLIDGFIAHLPLFGVALVVILFGVLVAALVGRWTERGLRRTSADRVAIGLTGRLVRFLIIVVFILLALSVAGVNIGVALAGLGIVGLAIAFALQNILENFVAGVLLMVRKPFRAGDQIQTGDVDGTVQEIDLRTTRIVGYDGVQYLVPNAEVFRNVLVNNTQRGKRRASVLVAIDYRNDHERAFEVLARAVESVNGVMPDPEPEVFLYELADSGVVFEIRFWALPQNRNVRNVQSRVLTAAKNAIEAEGMTIPWPIRTVVFDNPLPQAPED